MYIDQLNGSDITLKFWMIMYIMNICKSVGKHLTKSKKVKSQNQLKTSESSKNQPPLL